VVGKVRRATPTGPHVFFVVVSAEDVRRTSAVPSSQLPSHRKKGQNHERNRHTQPQSWVLVKSEHGMGRIYIFLERIVENVIDWWLVGKMAESTWFKYHVPHPLPDFHFIVGGP
jgi:hypothetical protein